MIVTVMRVRVVRMGMPQRDMGMSVTVTGAGLDWFVVRMLVVWITVVHVFMLVLERLVHMFVLMPLTQMQIDTNSHQ